MTAPSRQPGRSPASGASAAQAPAAATSPCPGCGRPVAGGSVLCTHCGQRIGREEQIRTKIGSERGLPPIPAVAPGPAHFRKPLADPLGRSERLKPLIVLIASLAIVTGWKFAGAGAGEAGAYLVRYAVTVAGSFAVVVMGAITFVELGVSIPLAALSVAAAVAGGDLVQHVIHYTLMPALAWMAAIVTCLMLLADFLDIDLPEAVFLGFAIYLLKWVLNIVLFGTMFGGG